jgi:hypothetical protein
MRSILALSFVALCLTACTSDPKETTSTGGNADLETRIAQLEKENEAKDQMINESLEFYTEIQSNLESIELKKDELRIKSTNAELSEDDKQWYARCLETTRPQTNQSFR